MYLDFVDYILNHKMMDHYEGRMIKIVHGQEEITQDDEVNEQKICCHARATR